MGFSSFLGFTVSYKIPMLTELLDVSTPFVNFSVDSAMLLMGSRFRTGLGLGLGQCLKLRVRPRRALFLSC